MANQMNELKTPSRLLQHNQDYKDENKNQQNPKKQKTIFDEFDPADIGEAKHILFTTLDDPFKIKQFDERILNNFDVLKGLYESIKHNDSTSATIPLSQENFKILPFINMIFVKKNFIQTMEPIIDKGNFDMEYIKLIITTIKFIDSYCNSDTLQNLCIVKNSWLFELFDYLLNNDKTDNNFFQKVDKYINENDDTKEQKISNIISNTLMICCNRYIDSNVKQTIYSGITIAPENITFLKKLPNRYAKYVLMKIFNK